MVESIVEVLVKEERRLEVIPAAVPLQSSSDSGLQPLCFSVFDIHLRSSQKKYHKVYIEGFRSKRIQW
jgi:hypothetical protein